MAKKSEVIVRNVTIKTRNINGNFGHINPLEFEGFRKEAVLKLNQIAIQQMQVLEGNSGRKLLK